MKMTTILFDENLRTEAGLKPRLLAAFSYMGVLCFVPLILNRSDEFVFFHSKQGLIIWIWGVLAVFALHVPVIGKFVFGISALGVLLYSLVGLVSVVLLKAWRLPIVYQLTAKLW
jgi:uncharacterized membrane protein